MKKIWEQLHIVFEKIFAIEASVEDYHNDCMLLGQQLNALPPSEWKLFWQVIDETLIDTPKEYICFLSAMSDHTDATYIYNSMLHLLCKQNIPLADLIACRFQIQSRIFMHPTNVGDKLTMLLYKKIVNQMKEICKEELNQHVFNTNHGDKKILLVTFQLLAEEHAPTFMIANLYNYLELLGYDVFVFILNIKHLLFGLHYWRGEIFVNYDFFEGSSEFQATYFNDIHIRGYQGTLHPETLKQDLNNVISKVFIYTFFI